MYISNRGISLSKKKYSISEVAKILDYENHVLRFYESEFDIKVPRDKNKRRQYTLKEIETFQYVKSLKEQGYNNNQIKEILKSPIVTESENKTVDTNLEGNEIVATGKKDYAIREIALHLENLNSSFSENICSIKDSIDELHCSIEELKKNYTIEETEDILSENEKLKTKLKEKTYELVEMRERYSQLEQKKFIITIVKRNINH